MVRSLSPVGSLRPGYARIVFMILSFTVCFTQPFVAAVCYCISQGLDAVDGQVARHFKQCSKFGAVLDMLTDRSAREHARAHNVSATKKKMMTKRVRGSRLLCHSLSVRLFHLSMSTAVLLIVLALQYQSLWGFFAFLVVLDIVSHWFQMVTRRATLVPMLRWQIAVARATLYALG